ncbi:MAG: InlB B-repeat-containing protein, partial [Acutalibacteraceae bacterium]|nr:InlB B-repeat-containing protein [Acutalibacteraceae bacterium]
TTESTVYFVERNEAGTDLSSDEIKKKVELKVLIPVDEIMDSKGLIADYVEIYAVENFKSTVPVAGHYTVRVRDDDKWSSWSTENPEGKPGVGEIQSKTQYQYKELQKTTVNTKAETNNLVAQGWTHYETTGPDPVEGNWSRTKPAALEYRTISEKTVTDYKTVKKYCYKRYAYQNSGTWWSYSSNWANNHGCKGKWEYKFTDKPLKEYKSFDGKMAYGSASDFWWAGNVNKQGDYTTAKVDQKVKSGSHKEYKAIDKIYTYHLKKWTNFSDWQDAYVEQKPDQTNQVQTQTVYRYQTDLPKRSTTDTTNQRDDFCVGNLGTEYAGKQVTLFIYKVTEASDWTTEYVAQTVVDPEGNYFFEPYILREEPTAITGDFTVTLGIEGADSAMYLGKIEVPDSEYEYTVTFKDKDDSVIDTQVVFRGEDAVVPEIPVHEGYTFSHWDMRSTDIRANTIINAIYIPNVYDVTYYDPMNTETPLTFGQYDHNAELVPPEAFDTAELKFIGWDKVLDGVTNIKENMVVTALYEPMTYEVTFNGIDNSGEVLSVQSVEYGDAPVVPEVEVPEDMIFFGWQAEGDETLTEVEMLSVTENTQLYPQYMFVNTTETPVADLESGSYSSAQTVRLSCDTESAVIYYTTDGTDPMMSETALEYNKATGIKVSDTCQLRFIATAFNMNVSQEATALYAINDGNEADKFLLNLEVPEWGTNAYTGIVNGGMVLEDGIPEYYGYTVAGAYLAYEFNEETGELTFSEPWDISTGTITEDKTIYLDYDANTYTVEFVDYDGVVLSEESVPYLSSAIAPEVSSREGYVFIGWDTDEYAAVTENLTVNAVYVPEDEYVTIELNRSSYTMMSGNTYTLTATTGGNVEKPEIIWASSDENVAVVDDNGVVTATGKGSAEIYAIIVDNGETATCKINVVGNPSDELTLVGKAHLSVDDYGYIRGFAISTDAETQEHYAETVAEVKSQFLNNELVFTDINGNVLSDDDSVGTGTVIKLMDGNKELDSITVVVSGDMDGDGYVTNKDASRISRDLVNKESPTEVQICAMDVNGDGYVNNRDASVVSRYLVGKETI